MVMAAAQQEAASLMEMEEEEEEEEEEEREERIEGAFYPSAPHSELFDTITTVDPSYIISLIRKLLPHNVGNDHNFPGVHDPSASVQGTDNGVVEPKNSISLSSSIIQNFPNHKPEAMETHDDTNGFTCQKGSVDDSSHSSDHHRGTSTEEAAWEEYGCILWDLSANKTHAEFMVENLLVEVLLASLSVSQSARITEISLGILANLACNEVPRNCIISTQGLIDTVVDQLFVDDSPCLCEAFRLLALGLQGSGSVTWAEALQPEPILCRILWVAENTLNSQLLEKSIGLLLAIVDNQQEVAQVLLPPLMKLGLENLLINLLASEVNQLSGERNPDRNSVLDMVLRVIEALSTVDKYSEVISSNKELLQLIYYLVKLPNKVEVSGACVTAVILIANILTDEPDLASELSQDLPLFQGLLGIIPFVSDDPEARSALWSVLGRVLVQVQENKMSLSTLHQYVSVLVDKSDVIEEDLIDHQLEDSNEDHRCSNTSGRAPNATTTFLHRIRSVLKRWKAIRVDISEKNVAVKEDHEDDAKVDRLLHCCCKYTK